MISTIFLLISLCLQATEEFGIIKEEIFFWELGRRLFINSDINFSSKCENIRNEKLNQLPNTPNIPFGLQYIGQRDMMINVCQYVQTKDLYCFLHSRNRIQ